MANFKKDKMQQDSNKIIDFQRAPVPESTALQQNILQLSKNLPQYIDDCELADVYHHDQRFGVAKNSLRSRFAFSPMVSAVAAGAAAIILSVMLWTPIDSSKVDESLLASSPPAMDELALQDVILMTDEMAFATL